MSNGAFVKPLIQHESSCFDKGLVKYSHKSVHDSMETIRVQI